MLGHCTYTGILVGVQCFNQAPKYELELCTCIIITNTWVFIL